jgi:hypothetical protein
MFIQPGLLGFEMKGMCCQKNNPTARALIPLNESVLKLAMFDK